MSTIPDYNTNPGAFVGWLDGQALDALPGNKNPKLAELVELLKGKITISTDLPTPLTKEQLEKLLAAYLTDPASIIPLMAAMAASCPPRNWPCAQTPLIEAGSVR